MKSLIIKMILKRALPALIGIAVVVLGAMWLYGFIGVKAGFVGPTDIPGLNSISHHGAETAGGVTEALKVKVGL